MQDFKFRDCEYVTTTGERWHWRRAFLVSIEKYAATALQELALLLPLRHDIADSLKHLSEFTQEDQKLIKNVEMKFVFFELPVWIRKYGLTKGRVAVSKAAKRQGIASPQQLAERSQLPYETCNRIWNDEPKELRRQEVEKLSRVLGIMPDRLFRLGPLQSWGTIVALDTLQYWDEDNPNATGKSFVPIGRDVHKRELLMANPQLIANPLSGMTPEEQSAWDREREEYLDAAKKRELILPPESFTSWAPFAQTRENYLASQEERLGRLAEKGDRQLVVNYRGMLQSYCDRLEAHYRQSGYNKLTVNKRNAEKHIAWVVQAHVLNKPYREVTDLDGNPVDINLQGVKARVDEVLEVLDLAPRENRRADRKASRQILSS